MRYQKQEYILGNEIKNAKFPNSRYFIAGGALNSVFSSAVINDLDVWFRSEYELNIFESYWNEIEKPPVKQFETDSAISYTCGGRRIQLIKKIFGTPKEIIDQFDFTVCMAAYNPESREFTFGDYFFEDLAARTLRYVPGRFPIASLWRSKKYMLKGYSFPAVESIKLAISINNLKMTTFRDLKEQLDGIDTLLLQELTSKMLEKSDEKYDMSMAIQIMEGILSDKLDA